MINVYIDDSCFYCKALINYLTINNINFTTVNINDAPPYIKSIGLIPIININSNIIEGFDIDKIDSNLNIIGCKHDSVYLDNAATTKLSDEVFKEMRPYMRENFANPSSIYSIGLKNRDVINKTRDKIATILNCDKEEIFFTSGGSEANNMAIKGISFANKHKGNHIITSMIEHSSVISTCKYLENKGFRVTYLPVNKYGLISIAQLEASITDKTILISIMHANNEIGTIQDIIQIGNIAKKHNVYFHTDAVQTAGKIAINLSKVNANLLSLSAHKFYGPKGIGVLYIKNNTKIDPLIHGGSQEYSMRAGTENVSNIVGLGKALELSVKRIDTNQQYIKSLQIQLISQILKNIPEAKLNGHKSNRLCDNVSITLNNLSYLDSYMLRFLLDTNRIYISSGSACNELNGTSSHVLKAIGLDDSQCNKTLRFTLGFDNTREDIDYTVNTLIIIINKLAKYYNREKIK